MTNKNKAARILNDMRAALFLFVIFSRNQTGLPCANALKDRVVVFSVQLA